MFEIRNANPKKRCPPNNQHSDELDSIPKRPKAGKRALRIFSIMLMYVDVASTYVNGVFSHKNTSYKQQKEKVRIPGQKS